MATENSPPQIRIILTVAFSSVVILAALNSVFRSYFLMMTEEVEHEHLSRPEELIKLRAGEQKNLTTSPLPISQAMQELATRGRTNYQAFLSQADITPQASNDLGPMVGWVRSPNQSVIDAINAAAANPPPEAAVVDGGASGAAASSDAGAAPMKQAPPGKPVPTSAAHDAGAH
ncbi:MAG: hypothetical protein ACLQVI_17585 [Polyangiaceae bacterium]|jgi:hypothetical protein